MPPSAVLFDFDGVIADTENHHVAAWQRTLLAMGWQVPEEIAARATEIDDRLFLEEIFERNGVTDGDIEGWMRKKQALMVQMLQDACHIYPGVVELLHELRGHVRLAVVSGTWKENVEAVLSRKGLIDFFELIVSKEDVSSMKPDPEVYRVALDRLHLAAIQTVAIEDSPAGLAAAREAGIPSIAIGHRREFGEWVGDSVYITGFDPTTGVLRQLGLDPEPQTLP
jgi:HAD superfamily hydrolase (TIGR01509 family)